MEMFETPLPDEVFLWLETKSFDQLLPEEQRIVLDCFPEATYRELHQTLTVVRKGRNPSAGGRKETILLHLLEEFDRKHPPRSGGRVRALFSSPSLFWKAATFALLLASTGLFFLWQNRNPEARVLSKTDTLFVVKEVKSLPERLRDTVYLTLPRPSKSRQHTPDLSSFLAGPDTPSGPAYSGLEPVGVVSLQDLNSEANQLKNNHMKSDSLLKRCTIVTL